ncbi:transcription antitermination factor NusB [Patescibacteria group bacterium]|nr:MAG: transcription antitermination factor NusB [Patescibacteria group bacterium]
MASRHLSRSQVLQTLFECDSTNTFTGDAAHAILLRNTSEFLDGDADIPFAEGLLLGIIAKKEEIDQMITVSAPQWPIENIAPIDRNVLRVGLYELLFGDKNAVPPKVALNEAIELAKAYGGDTSGKFVNGVLGAVYRSIGSPGKNDALKETVPLKHEHLGGLLLVAPEEGAIKVALVLDAFKKWTLPKSKCIEGELSEHAALRALKEELGVSVEKVEPIGEHEYIAHDPATGKVIRSVGYFLGCATAPTNLIVTKVGGIEEARWFSEEELGTISLYDDLLPVIETGVATAKKICL